MPGDRCEASCNQCIYSRGFKHASHMSRAFCASRHDF